MAPQQDGIQKEASEACLVTLYEHWEESEEPHKKFKTGFMKTLRGTGAWPLKDFLGTSSVRVQGSGCVAYGYTNDDCSGEKGQGITAPDVVSGSDELTAKWGCNDCARCVRVEHSR
jgi:hypothetical protein